MAVKPRIFILWPFTDRVCRAPHQAAVRTEGLRSVSGDAHTGGYTWLGFRVSFLPGTAPDTHGTSQKGLGQSSELWCEATS